MKSRKNLAVLALTAIGILALPITAYVGTFGAQWSRSQEVWGQFGDFFGGFLNPLFALLAFLAVVYNVNLQSQQLEVARDEFRAAAASTQAQIGALREQANRQELVAILHSLSESMDKILDEVVSEEGTRPILLLRHVLHEGWRLRNAATRSSPYDQYVLNARTGGTMIEILHNQLRAAADDLAHFVPLYAAIIGEHSPVLKYYSHRYLGLGTLLAEVGGARGATIDFFLKAERAVAA